MIVTLSYEEVKALLKKKMPQRTRALIAFQYASGCRIGELLNYKHTICNKNTKYKKEYYKTKGLLKSNINIAENEMIWKIPNFKVKNKKRKVKVPFILKEEKLLWFILNKWLETCGEQVFEIKESHARNLTRQQLKPYSSHVLRKSRGTHLVDIFGFNVYEVMESLGHSSMESGLAYISTVNKKNKMRRKLLQLNKEKESEE